jgi:hypothetical protein
MKKFLVAFSFVLLSVISFSSPNPAYADLCPDKNSGFARLCDLRLNEASDITSNIVTVLLIFAIIVCLIYLVYGGIRWIMSGGDKNKLEAAQGAVRAAIIGLIVALSAYFFLNIIIFLFTGETILNFEIPTIVP